MGFISGYLAQWLYASALGDNASEFTSALVRGLGWSVMGIGIGLAVGLIKPEAKKNYLLCIRWIYRCIHRWFLIQLYLRHYS